MGMDSLANAPSLLNYLDAPVVVADPVGNVVFLNPAFELTFTTTRERAEGSPLAALFEGGDREAVLGAVAATCSRGQSVRFRIRHHDIGFQVIASPISVEGQRVGAVLLLTEEALETEALHRVQRELRGVAESLDEAVEQLAQPDDRIGAERAEWSDSARRAVAELRRAAVNLDRMTEGRARSQDEEGMIDPSRVLRDALAGVAYEMSESGASVDVLTAPDLPMVKGDAKRLQEALEALLRARLTAAPDWLALAARRDDEDPSLVLLLLSDPKPADGAGGTGVPPVVQGAVAALGGALQVGGDDVARTTAIVLPAV